MLFIPSGPWTGSPVAFALGTMLAVPMSPVFLLLHRPGLKVLGARGPQARTAAAHFAVTVLVLMPLDVVDRGPAGTGGEWLDLGVYDPRP
ncbi:hypothetical protein [Streptomyces sp. NPDC058751]|uniref:hypothetical protein n=1 Tax=Streptomyces sp. NPDC058751 TaxID=3346623 RepID=UPI003684DA5D